MQLPVIIKLTRPVKHGEDDVTELKITRPMVAGDLRGIKVTEMTFDDLLLVGSRLTGYPPSVLAQLSVPDFTRLNGVVMAFFDGGPETGSKA